MTRPRTVFPVGLLLEGRLCVVLGDGPEQLERVHMLLDAGARLRVVSARPAPGIDELAVSGQIELRRREPGTADLDDAWLAVQVEENAQLAATLSAEAQRRRLFFCALDQPRYNGFSHLARVQSGPVSVAISTAGRAPALARRLRQELTRVFEAAGLAAFARDLGKLRDRTPREQRRQVLAAAVSGVRLGKLELPSLGEKD